MLVYTVPHQQLVGRKGQIVSILVVLVRSFDVKHSTPLQFSGPPIRNYDPFFGHWHKLAVAAGLISVSCALGWWISAWFTDYDFHPPASLATAIVFHPLFEDLSLGIRTIHAAPSKKKEDGLQPLSKPTRDKWHINSSWTHVIKSCCLVPKIQEEPSYIKWVVISLRHSRIDHGGQMEAIEITWLKPTLSFFFARYYVAWHGMGLVVFGLGMTDGGTNQKRNSQQEYVQSNGD